MKPERIYLDVDGVLANWTASICELFDRDPAELAESWPPGVWDVCQVLDVDVKEVWLAVDEAGADFWANLAPMPWADELYALCRELAPTTLLTSPSLHPSSLAGKLRWMQGRFGRHFRDYLIGPAKVAVAHPKALLIDDRPDTVAGFGQAGGHALLFPALGNELRVQVGDPMAHVEPMLRAHFAN